jgi:hypothetical protein
MSQGNHQDPQLHADPYRRIAIQAYREGQRDGIEDFCGTLGQTYSELLPPWIALIVLEILLKTIKMRNVFADDIDAELQMITISLRRTLKDAKVLEGALDAQKQRLARLEALWGREA